MIAAGAIVLAAAALCYVLAPLWRRPRLLDAEDCIDRPRLLDEREAALRTLRDLALDHATGKMSDADYEALRAKQETVAIDAMRRLDGLDAPTASGAETGRTAG